MIVSCLIFVTLALIHQHSADGNIEAERFENSILLLKMFNLNKYVQLKNSGGVHNIGTVPEEAGVYMFVVVMNAKRIKEIIQGISSWPKPATTDALDMFPVYFGETNNLYGRLSYHASMSKSAKGFAKIFDELKGVRIQQDNIQTNVKNLENVFVFYKQISKFAAMCVESTFLENFDFAFNIQQQAEKNVENKEESKTEETKKERDLLVTGSVENYVKPNQETIKKAEQKIKKLIISVGVKSIKYFSDFKKFGEDIMDITKEFIELTSKIEN